MKKRLPKLKNLLYSTFNKDQENHKNYCGKYYYGKWFYEVLRKDKQGLPVLETWAMKRVRGGALMKLCQRSTIWKNWINADCSQGFMMPGWTVNYLEEPGELVEHKVVQFGSYYNSTTILWSIADLKNNFKDYKYVQHNHNDYVDIEFLRAWIQYPHFEMLAKAGLENFRFYKTLLNQTSPEWMEWVRQNQKELRSTHFSSKFILQAFKKGLSIIQAENLSALKHLGCSEEWILKQKERIYKYSYEDYIEAQKKLNVRINYEPNNFTAAHNKVISKLKIINNKEINEKLKVLANRYKNNINLNGLHIKIFESVDDMEEVATKLQNCLVRMNYAERMVSGDDYCFAIYQNNEPIECVEMGIDKNEFYIKQCLGKDNEISEYHDDCIKLCNKFSKQFIAYA